MLFYFYNFILNIVYAPSKKKKNGELQMYLFGLTLMPFPSTHSYGDRKCCLNSSSLVRYYKN